MKARLLLITLIAGGIGAASAPETWSRIGTPEQVQITAGKVALNVPEAASVGALSSSVELSRADSVLITATVADATARGLTFAAQDARTGETVGYWQNPSPIESETPIAAVLELSQKVDHARLFVGAHGQPSAATIDNVRWTPVRRGDAYLGSIYAAAVDGKRDQSQTFKAAGKLAAVTIRARHAQPGRNSQGLRVRVFEWTESPALTRRSAPIAETVVPASLIPDGAEGNEKDISIALSAPTQSGKTYLISFAAPNPSVLPEIYLWTGPEGYAGGTLYENDQSPVDWDLYFKTYHE